MASSDENQIVELEDMETSEGCNYKTNKTLENMNETPLSSGNQDIINLADTTVGNDQKDSQLEHIYWYIGGEKYYPSYPQEPAPSKSSVNTTTVSPQIVCIFVQKIHRYIRNLNI